MKEVDMNGVEVVQSGDTWTFPLPPCSRTMIPCLERNESLVTWVQAWPGMCVCRGKANPNQFRVTAKGW